MTTTRFQPWLCHRCGYMMDAASGVDNHAVPKEDDVSFCLNCATPYVLHDSRWALATDQERRDFPDEIKQILVRAQIAVAMAPWGDLSKRDRTE